MDMNEYLNQLTKQEKRETRLDQLSVVLSIVTTVAIIFVSMAIIVFGAIKFYDDQSKPAPACKVPSQSRPV
jgi:Mn2+/Fe2+ NRAMP family transporter